MAKIERKPCYRLLLLAACGLAMGSPLRLSADSAVDKMLLAKAQSLAAHGRLDLAVQAWQQVLLSDPSNRDAVRGIAKADMQLGKTEEAQKYVERLRALGDPSADLEQITGMAHEQPQAARLSEAGRLAREGQYAGAMRIYRDIFGDEPPAGDIARAYYDTEAALPESRPHAIAGMRRLSKQFPGDPEYAITLGRILTYDPKTRAEGIALLTRHGGSAEAQTALRQATAWSDDGGKQAAVSGTAPAVSKGVRKSAQSSLEGSGYRALNSGNLDRAEQQFEQLLARQPGNRQALSGLGYAYMKEGDFARALDSFRRARAGGARGLDEAIATASFWDAMSRAKNSLQSGDAQVAVEQYRQALLLKPASQDAKEDEEEGLASALLQVGKPAEAVDILKGEVSAASGREAAWRNLFLAQSAMGDAQAALSTRESIPKSIRADLESDPGFLLFLANDDLALGLKLDAAQVAARALALPFPNHGLDLPVEKQLQFAGLLIVAKRPEAAIELYQQALAKDDGNAGAWLALAGAQHQLGRDDAAFATLGRMPQAVYERSQNDLGFLQLVASLYQSRGELDRAQIYLEKARSAAGSQPSGVDLQLAGVYEAEGELEKAHAIYRGEVERNPGSEDGWRGLLTTLHAEKQDRDALRELASLPEATRFRLEQDPLYLQTLASIETAAGENKDALRTFRQLSRIYIDLGDEEPVEFQLQYGWLLFKMGDDAGLYSVISHLANVPGIAGQQKEEFDGMLAAWSLRRASGAMAAGNPRQAIAILETAVRAFPKNQSVDAALAGAYLQAGQPKQALAVYFSLDILHADSAEVQGAIGAALAARNIKQAGTWLKIGLDRFVNDPAILRMAAEYEQARGDSGRAAAYYRAALDAMGPEPLQDAFSHSGTSTAAAGVEHSSASPARDLVQLLASPGSVVQSENDADGGEARSGVDVSLKNEPGADISMRPTPRASTLNDFASPEIDALRDSSPAPADTADLHISELRAAADTESNAAVKPQEIDGESESRLGPPPTPGRPDLDEALGNQSPQPLSAVLPPLSGSAASTVDPKTPRQQIEQQLAVIDGSSSSWLGGTSTLDYRSGEPGYDRLSIYSAQAESSAMIGPGARATVIVEPVLLDAGQAAGTETYQQGTLPANAVPYVQSAAGVGGEFQLQTSAFAARLGYTPHGFLVQNVIGGLYIHPPGAHFTLDFSRDPILDTQLSFAGLRDEASSSATYAGNSWGGVIASAGELQVNYGDDRAGWYLQGGGQYITGSHVPVNKRFDGDGGAYWAAWKSSYGDLTAGMNFFGMHYQRNLRYFTYGQGGYFSPGAYMLGAVPLTFNGRYGEKFHYRATGSLGVQAFEEDSAPYYPLDSAVQAAQGNPYYPERTTAGGNYNLDAEGSYSIAEHWYVGGFMAFNNSRDYASDRIGFFLRFVARPQPESEEGGPAGLFPVQGLRPLRVP